ncbi:putative mitochondrial LSU ribosomal protein L4 precursor [Cercophora samala]|uniref:Large ribosomal subunit protein uL4m n=1 Tax=Cercophora samala TaxID=330535 RepID=A0AA39ZAL2_9PEZI|nr:putative mitochondrial LSU ribosomal protein L4 precursor [Cercophora samala]
MAGKGMRCLSEAMRGLSLGAPTCRTVPVRTAPLISRRSMATEAPVSNITRSVAEQWTPITTVPVTVHAFPTLEPRSLETYSAKHLYLPLRRDILHLAVVYEGDNTRQGTAQAKTRWEVAGSHRKVRPQKGSGRARVGTKQSPIQRGGGKSHGPRNRDFGTSLNRKVYDLAWRTALSYRYRRGELIVTEDGLDLPLPEDFLQQAQDGLLTRELEDAFIQKYVGEMLGAMQWGKAHGRTTFITGDERMNLFTAMEVAGENGTALQLQDVDVKDLLETGRIVMERSVLKEMIRQHRSDLVSSIVVPGMKHLKEPALGTVLYPLPKSPVA